MKFLEMFNEIQKGNFALTDEAVYKSIANQSIMIPLYGGNKTHIYPERFVASNAKTNEGKEITLFKGDGVIISLDGSAGSMTYKNNETFALNHHAGFFTVKNNNVINPQFFALFYENRLKSMSVSDGSGTLTLEQIYNEDFDIPSLDKQCRILNKILPLIKTIEKLCKMIDRIEKILNKQFDGIYSCYQAENIYISELLDCLSGNSGLTEEFIYSTINIKGNRFTVLSSSTDESTEMGEIPLCNINNKPIKVFENKDGLLVARNGNAGQTRFLKAGHYTINDHAYILSVKSDCRYSIDLQWLAYQYKKDFLLYSSTSDNGTWNKTGFFKNTKIDIPSIEEQQKISKIYQVLDDKAKKIKKLKNSLNNLLQKEII